MDFHMPVMDGFEATKNIRSLEKYLGFSVPIIGLTGDDVSNNPQLQAQAKQAGMNKVLTKPINLDVLSTLLKDLGN